MGNVTAKTSGDIASFITPAETNITSLKVHFSPKQLGEGDPSPENVREIVGWDGVEVNGCGKNLINTNTVKQGYRVNIQGEVVLAATYCLTDYIPVFPSSKYYLSNAGTLAANACTAFYDKNKELLSTTSNITPITTPNNCAYIRCSFKIENIDIVQLELGSAATLYKPYQGNTISYQWKLPDEYQEVEYVSSEINSSSHPYINTGIIPNENMRIYLEGITGDDVNGAGFLFGSRTKPSSATTGRFWGITWQNQYRYGYMGDSNTVIKNVNTNESFIIDFNFNNVHSITVNSTTINPKTSFDDEYIYPIFLFGINNGGKIDTGQQRSFSVKKFIIYDNYNDIKPTMSLVPCYRKSNNEIGMYDTVSQTFYTNQGTGEFLKGEDVDKTFYGGYVDLISGELVEEYYSVIENGQKSWSFNNYNDNYYRVFITPSTLEVPNPIINSNKQFYNISLKGSDTTKFNGWIGSTGNFLFYLPQSLGITTKDEWVKFLSINPLQICYPLTTPITHQLTPTQLSSFIGQNNFWSNADYVEIEYELKETEDIQKARKKIILNQPQLKTVSDKVVSFNTDMVAPLKNCKIYFNPIQLGSGDPSPTNVRNINGWTSIDSYANGNKVSVDWTNDIGTVYGGYVDLVKGELVATQVGTRKKLSEATTKGQNSNGVISYTFNFAIPYGQILNKYGSQKCSVCGYSWNMSDFQQNHFFGYYSESTGNRFLLFLLEDHGLNDDAEIDFMSELTSPVTFQLTPQQLLTFKSTNHIWSETNGQQIDVKYWSRKNLTPTPLTDYLENQTWIDSAYIGSSGKKTTGGTSASHFLTNQILLEAGTYVLSGFSHYVGTDNTNFRIHAYDSTGKWLRQIAYKQIGNLSPVDISFTLDTDTYVNVSIAMDFDGVLAKTN